MTNIVYSKFNNYRKDKYAIYTTVEQTNDGKKYVYKNASNSESYKFLESLQSKYEFIAKLYKSSKIIPITPLAQGSGKLKLDYLPYPNLKTIITEKLVQEDIDAAIKLITSFFEAIFEINLSDVNTSSYTLDSYHTFFGNFQPSDKGSYIADINFNNFLIADDKYYLVDYEWVFDKLVPADYLILRNIYYLIEDTPNLSKQTVNALFRHFKFDQKKNIFVDYESKFIEYIAKNTNTNFKLHLETTINKLHASDIKTTNANLYFDALEQKHISLKEKTELLDLKQKELDQIYNSISWKLTYPIRFGLPTLRKFFRKA